MDAPGRGKKGVELNLNSNKLCVWGEWLTYKALVVVAEPSEELIGGIEKGLTNQLKPLPTRASPVQRYRKNISVTPQLKTPTKV